MSRRALPPPPLMAPTPSNILPGLVASIAMGWAGATDWAGVAMVCDGVARLERKRQTNAVRQSAR